MLNQLKFNFLFLLVCCSICIKAQQVKVVNYAQLENEFKVRSDTLKAINFWATWCKPCLEEMPYFVKAQEEYKNQKVNFIYVSLDFSKEKNKVEQVANRIGLKGKIFLLKDNPNVYINKIDPAWEGQIPISLIVQPDGSYVTHKAQFDNFEELNNFIIKNVHSTIKN